MNPNLDPTASQFTPEEQQVDRALRPKGLIDFSGQQKIVNNLEIFIKAAKMREEALDHVLLHGPPGLGKTTLSLIIASEMGANMKMTSGPVLEKAGDLAGLLTNLEEGDVLFRRVSLLCDGRLSNRYHDRYRTECSKYSNRTESIYIGRSYNSNGTIDCSNEGKIWYQFSFGLL